MISTSPIKISCVIRADQVPAGGQGAARRRSSWATDAIRKEEPTGEHHRPTVSS